MSDTSFEHPIILRCWVSDKRKTAIRGPEYSHTYVEAFHPGDMIFLLFLRGGGYPEVTPHISNRLPGPPDDLLLVGHRSRDGDSLILNPDIPYNNQSLYWHGPTPGRFDELKRDSMGFGSIALESLCRIKLSIGELHLDLAFDNTIDCERDRVLRQELVDGIFTVIPD